MLYWTLLFLIVALVAAFLGFGGVAIAAAGIAKILFFIFLVLFLCRYLRTWSAGFEPASDMSRIDWQDWLRSAEHIPKFEREQPIAVM